MLKKPETKFKEKVLKDLKAIDNIWVFKTQEVAVKGIPDLILCVNGYFMALELKMDDDDLEPLQSYNLIKIQKCFGAGFEVTPKNWPTILTYIKKRASLLH